MATVQRFEDLYSWQKARELTNEIYKAFRGCRDFGLKNQIERAAVSAMANQAEGFCRGTKIELINYFYIAKGSAGEVQSHLYVALDAQHINMSKFRHIYGLADETQKLIQSFVDRVKSGAFSGLQYRNVDISKYREDPYKKLLQEAGMILTLGGRVMKRGDAERLGLEVKA